MAPNPLTRLQEQNRRLVWTVEIRERDLDSALKAIQRIYGICLGNANLDTISTTKIMGIVASFPSAVPNPDLLAELKGEPGVTEGENMNQTVTLRIPADNASAREHLVAGFADLGYFTRIKKIKCGSAIGYEDMYFVDVVIPEDIIMEEATRE